MRALMYVGPRKVEWQEIPKPKLEDDGDAIVKPLAVTRCDLDLLIVSVGLGWDGGFGLGHETVGIVAEVGDSVSAFKPGDRVIVPFQISCGTCSSCARGFTAHCTAVPFRSSYGMAPLSGVDYGGSLSDFVRVPFADNMLLSCPEEISDVSAAGIADNVSDGFRIVAPHLAKNPGAKVLIVGGLGQGIGLYAADAARALGAQKVVYLDDCPKRLEYARSLGVTVLERKSFEGVVAGSPYPITVDASGVDEGMALAIRSTEHGGVCHRCHGGVEPTAPVPLPDMYRIGLDLHLSRVNARAVMPDVIEHVQCGHLHPEKIISRTASFDDAAEAILDPTIKVVFLNEDT